MDLLLVVGGYNSSNTAHLVEIGEKELPTFFIRDAEQIKSLEEIVHYDLRHHEERTANYADVFSGKEHVTVGLTAGASCPNNLIEAAVRKVFELRGSPIE
jgi:4-hydroxy-3-methylbut-2-enyl diphosphate reductase